MMLNKFRLSAASLKNFCSFCKKYSIIFLFACLFIFQFYVICTEDTLQVDEAASFVVATSGNKTDDLIKWSFCSVSVKDGVEYNIKDLYDIYFVPNNTPAQILKDLSLIRLQMYDNAHPSLYYSLLRIWDIFLPASDYQTMLKWGRFLNLIFFSFAFFFMYKLLNLLFEDKNIVFMGMVFAFANISILSLTTMTREYALQSSLFILVTYLFALLYKKPAEEKLSVYEIVTFGIGLGLYLLSGYFATISVVLYLGILILKNCKNKKNILSYIEVMLITYIVVYLLCPNYITILLETFLSIDVPAVSAREPLLFYLEYTVFCLEKYIFYKPVFLSALFIFFLGLIMNIKNIKFDKKAVLPVLLVCITLVCIFIELKYAYFHMVRYVLPLFPVVSILYLLLLAGQKRIIQIFVAVIFVLFISTKIPTEYLDCDKKSITEYPHYVYKIPIVLSGSYYHILSYIFLHSDNDNILVFSENDYDPGKYKYPKYYVNVSKKTLNSDNAILVRRFYDGNMYFINNVTDD